MFTSLLFSFVLGLFFANRVNDIYLGIIVIASFLIHFFSQNKHHSHSNLLIMESYSCVSPLAKINPVLKLIFSFILIILVVSLKPILTTIFILITSIFIFTLISKSSLHTYLSLMEAPLIFLLISTIGVIVSIGSVEKGYIDFKIFNHIISISRSSQEFGIRLFITSLTCVSILINIGISTPMGDIIFALRKLKLPWVLIEIMYLIYRYIFSLSYMLKNMQISSLNRFGFKDMKNTYTSAKYISSRLFNNSIRKAFNSYNAMESRLYDGQLVFLEKKYPFEKKSLFIPFYLIFVIATAVMEVYIG